MLEGWKFLKRVAEFSHSEIKHNDNDTIDVDCLFCVVLDCMFAVKDLTIPPTSLPL